MTERTKAWLFGVLGAICLLIALFLGWRNIELRKENRRLSTMLAQTHGESAKLAERVTELSTENGALTAQVAALTAELAQVKQQLSTCEEKCKELRKATPPARKPRPRRQSVPRPPVPPVAQAPVVAPVAAPAQVPQAPPTPPVSAPAPQAPSEGVILPPKPLGVPNPAFPPSIATTAPQPSTFFVDFPGSAWDTAGTVAPIEKGNVINHVRAEQGFALLRKKRTAVVVFGMADYIKDSDGYDWNNRTLARAGVKVVQTFDNGIVQAGGGYMHEERFKSNRSAGHTYGFVNYWAGWDPVTTAKPAKPLFSSYPGSSWGEVGNISPVEGKDQVIAQVFGQQGVVAARIAGISLVPYLEGSVTTDRKGYSWNNRYYFGPGAKLARPFKSGIVEFGTSYRTEHRWKINRTDRDWVVYGNFWYGWNPGR